ncbi:MAG: elongation factor G [Planctomycetes bacterium]|nr:elongation factor G [Planctomycetota bacterium]
MAGVEQRNIALVGHGGAGKTTLGEAMLHVAGAVSRQGTIGDKNTVSDFADDERERGHSIDASLLHAPYAKRLFQIVDAPGYPDFLGQALRAIDAVDCAILVVGAYEGVALNTKRAYQAARERGIPVILVVNKCDAENIDLDALDKGIADLCGKTAKAVTVPDVFGSKVSMVRSIFRDAPRRKIALIETAVEAEDALMERYLEAGEISDDDLHRAIPLALAAGTLTPVFHTCADRGLGVKDLLDFVAEFGPSPVARTIEDQDGNELACDASGPVLGLCFKVVFDRQAGKLAFVRLFRGTLRSGDSAVVARTEESIKVGHMSRFNGSQKSDLDQAVAGDIIALPKVDNLAVGDTVHAAGSPVQLRLVTLPAPMVGLALVPKARGDEAKIGRELARITDADPCLTYSRSADTHELVLRGLSTLHLDISLKRLAHAGVEVETHIPKVPYLESITGKAEGHYRHKKQSGGAGQFGEVFLRVEPLARGSAEPLEYVDGTVGGSIPKQFIPAIEKGIRQRMQEGILSGCKIVDVRVTVYDGKYHDVDSKEIAFIIAGRNAFTEAFQAARPALLEPVMNVEIALPAKYLGDITGDLNSRRARITGMDTEGDHQIIKATAPLSEMQTYSTQLRSMTHGEGTFSMVFDHYDAVPSHLAQAVIAKYQSEKKKDDDS